MAEMIVKSSFISIMVSYWLRSGARLCPLFLAPAAYTSLGIGIMDGFTIPACVR